MVCVAITGGIGSGKSTIASLLESFGAARIDTDVVARDVVAPGTKALDEIVAIFGHKVLKPDHSLDRRALADIVFADPDALQSLNRIVHPLVRHATIARMQNLHKNEMVIVEIPLLVEGDHGGKYPFDVVVLVDCDEDIALARVLRSRHADEKNLRARIRSQASRTHRQAVANIVFDNSITRTPSELEEATRLLYWQLREA